MTPTDHFISGRPLSLNEAVGPAMTIREPEDAANYLAAYAAYLQRSFTDDVAREIALRNIGDFAADFMDGTFERVTNLFYGEGAS